tara:strand:+ start:1084 stop:1455 length:372 start_codon:yes stop_codon:yes gene_type:complete
VLFHYVNRTTVEGKLVENNSSINPLQVISTYWEKDEKSQIEFLNIFTTAVNNGKTWRIRFPKKMGDRFMAHMDWFLSGLLTARAEPAVTEQRHSIKVDKPHRKSSVETLPLDEGDETSAGFVD